MDIKKLILAEIKQKAEIRMGDLLKKVDFSRAYLNRFLAELTSQGKIIRLGAGRGARYVSADPESMATAKKRILSFRRKYRAEKLAEDVVLGEIKNMTGIFAGLPKNVDNILSYAFLEMLNNAIEHSRSREIIVSMENDHSTNAVGFTISDSGVGVFENVRRKFNLPDIYSAILHLLKGKQTTDEASHSGQGIFFTSKMADAFLLASAGKRWRVNNIVDDWFIEDVNPVPGTTVTFYIAADALRRAEEVFGQFTSPEDFEFNKTKVAVKLYKYSDNLLSRSEARRIVFGLEKFSEITLDFAGVETVGQGFVDEIFRVWRVGHPEIKVDWINANENVVFMIKNAG